MRKLLIVTLLTALTLLSGQVLGDVGLTTSGQVRLRCEFDVRSFDTSRTLINASYLRTRLGLKAEINDNAYTFIQFQDSRRLGDNNTFGTAASGGLNDGQNVDVHQAYLQVEHLWGENGMGLKAGRFEVAHGNERVFGPVGWSNIGRTWEGMNLFCDRHGVDFDAYWLRKMERFDPSRNADFDIVGMNAVIQSLNLDLFGFLENDAFIVSTPGDSLDVTPTDDSTYMRYSGAHNQMQRITLGMYYHRDHNQFDFELNAAYQLGKIKAWDVTVDSSASVDSADYTSAEHDIAALMATFEVGYSLSSMNTRLALGIDYTSGDDDATDNKHKAYNNLYYTGHKFRGAMDYFVGSGNAGLMDMMFRAKLEPMSGWTLKGDFHYFTTAADYVSYDGKTTTDVGMEFDLSLTTDMISGVNFVAGGSVFLPEEAYAGMKDPETAFWGYLMMTASF